MRMRGSIEVCRCALWARPMNRRPPGTSRRKWMIGLSWLQEQEGQLEIVALAALAHHKLVAIHPFH
jgi:hypothetical protein